MDTSVNHLLVSMHAADEAVALCSSVAFAAGANSAPEWVHLLPQGEIRTGDGRGPYRFAAAEQLIAASLQAGERLVIDENHATDLAAPKGLPAPAMGWVTELQARADGIWGKVEWTDAGKQLVAGRAYRGISPVIAHDKAGNIAALLRASLVNKPNLRGLQTLHSEETDMNLLQKLAKALGLPDSTSEDTLVTAITTLHAEKAKAATDQTVALQAQLDPLAEAAGLTKGAKADDIVAAVKQLVAGNADSATIVGLQAELKAVGDQLVSIQSEGKKKTAEAFVDAAIAKGRVGVKPQRDRYVTLHMADPAGTEAMINDLPALGGTMLTTAPIKTPAGEVSLNAEQLDVAKALGIDPKAFAETLKAEEAL